MADRRAHSRRRRYRCTPDRRLSAAPAEQLYRLPYLPRWTNDCAAMGLCRRCDRDQCRDDTPIGRASGRERVCQYVEISGVAVQLKKKHTKKNKTIQKEQ